MRVALVHDRLAEGERDAEFLVSIHESWDQVGYSLVGGQGTRYGVRSA